MSVESHANKRFGFKLSWVGWGSGKSSPKGLKAYDANLKPSAQRDGGIKGPNLSWSSVDLTWGVDFSLILRDGSSAHTKQERERARAMLLVDCRMCRVSLVCEFTLMWVMGVYVGPYNCLIIVLSTVPVIASEVSKCFVLSLFRQSSVVCVFIAKWIINHLSKR